MSTFVHNPTITLTNSVHTGLPDGVAIPGSVLVASATPSWDYSDQSNGPSDVYGEWLFGWSEPGVVLDLAGLKFEDYDPVGFLDKVSSRQFQATLGFPPGFTGWQQPPEGVVYGKYILDFVAYENYEEELPYSSKEINYYAYSAPSITSFSASRCNSDGSANDAGTAVKVSVVFVVTALGNGNTKTLTVKYRESGTTTWSSPVALDVSELGFSDTLSDAVLSGAEFDTSKNYELKTELTDSVTTSSNLKTVGVATVTYEVDTVSHKFSVGKRIEADGPQFDVAEDLRVGMVSKTLAGLIPFCKLSEPTSESLVYNSSYYAWVFAFQTVERNDLKYDDTHAFGILLGGSGGARQMGWEITEDGYYRASVAIVLSGSNFSSISLGVLRLPSTWTPPTVNYQTESSAIASALKYGLVHIQAYNSSMTEGEYVFEFYAEAGDKIWPYAVMANASKTINSSLTWAGIQRIG